MPDLKENPFLESGETFRQLAENISDAFWIRSPDMSTVHYVSPAFERIWGRPVATLYTHPERWPDFIHAEDRGRVLAAFATLVGEATSVEIEYRILRPDGEIRWVHVRGFPIRDGNAALLRHAGIVTDITARKHAEQERQQLQDAVVSVAAGVSGESGAASFERLALNLAKALGAQAAFVARWLPSRPPTARTIAAVIEGSVVGNFDFLITDSPCEALAAGSTCIVSGPSASLFPDSPVLTDLAAHCAVGHCLNSSSGQLLGLLFVLFRGPATPVNYSASTLQIFAARAASELERQNTDAQVREQAALLDVAHDAIQVRDLDGRILYWNKGAERLFGWTSAEALGRDSVELMYTHPARFDQAHADLIAKGEWQGEIDKRTKDGRDLIVEARWTLVRDATGAPTSVLAINTDITSKKRVELQFLRAQRMEGIGTLAAGIAHDLNNVLAPILMSIEMLKGAVATDEDRTLLATLDGSAQRGAELVKQVLSYARGVEGQRVPVNPLQVMRELVQVMRDTFPKSIEVRFAPAMDLWTMIGDPSQIQQVCLNLCVNGRDAMPHGGVLAIAMRNVVLDERDAPMSPDARPGAFVMVEVADNGTGIADDTRDRIFEPFFTTRELGKGTGLGLSTTLAIVRSHGGFIRLDSEVGKGTTFGVYLPATATETIRADGAAAPAGPPRGDGELVLVVDDEEAIRTVAKRLLERNGYRVLTACNGAEALVVYAAHGHDVAVVLTDMAMPGMDGLALVKALKALAPQVRILGTSGLTSVRELGLPAEDFLPKPYTAATMLRALHRIVHRSPSEAEAAL
jgi:PAS domain S-box-containing protein